MYILKLSDEMIEEELDLNDVMELMDRYSWENRSDGTYGMDIYIPDRDIETYKIYPYYSELESMGICDKV